MLQPTAEKRAGDEPARRPFAAQCILLAFCLAPPLRQPAIGAAH
jgi:hypothetical protein